MDEIKKDLLVTLADANFIDQAKQLFASVYFNAGWKGDYLLIACGVPEADLIWFRDKGILIYAAAPLADKPLGLKPDPPVVLAKFYLFKEYFKTWRHIVFLDADIIVQTSLDGLLKLDGFNAVNADKFPFKRQLLPPGRKLKEIITRYDLKSLTFNSGVFTFDTNIIKENTFQEIWGLYEKYKDILSCVDESTLNIFFYRNWKMLPLNYNSVPWYMKLYYGVGKDKMLAFAIHFVFEKIKPWDTQSPYYGEWLGNLNGAEMINLQVRPEARKIIGTEELSRYLRYLKIRKIIYFAKPISLRLFMMVDKQIGRLGLFIKKKNPKLYTLISRKK